MNLPVDLVPPGSDWTVTQRLKGGGSYSIMLTAQITAARPAWSRCDWCVLLI